MKGNMRGLIRTVPGRGVGVGWRAGRRVRWGEGGGGRGVERSQAPTKAIDIPPVLQQQQQLWVWGEAPPQATYSPGPKAGEPSSAQAWQVTDAPPLPFPPSPPHLPPLPSPPLPSPIYPLCCVCNHTCRVKNVSEAGICTGVCGLHRACTSTVNHRSILLGHSWQQGSCQNRWQKKCVICGNCKGSNGSYIIYNIHICIYNIHTHIYIMYTHI